MLDRGEGKGQACSAALTITTDLQDEATALQGSQECGNGDSEAEFSRTFLQSSLSGVFDAALAYRSALERRVW